MAETKAQAKTQKKGIDEGELTGVAVVQSTTTETPAEADKTSQPNALDGKADDPPVRAARPDTPIAQTLAAGAGEHMPADPDEFDPTGRPRSDEESEETSSSSSSS
jgi:hypothetical protein